MRKNRNAFFSENNPQGGYMPYQNGMPMMPGIPNFDDLQERLAKLERQISRLEHRISRLENNTTKTTDDFDNPASNMYMI